MTDNEFSDDEWLEKIKLETETIKWSDLKYFFAKGKIIYVSPSLNLYQVVLQFSKNNAELTEELMQKGLVKQMPDDIAQQWFHSDITVLTSVLDPWVLVQEVLPKAE